MAFFIVIGASNDVKCVVDEVKTAHLQHNVVTSGCIIQEEDGLYYHWDVFNEKGDKTNEKSKESIYLHNALTNQISQFKTLLPDDAIPNVFFVSKCFDEVESDTLQMLCDELCQIGGAKLSGLQIDIVLLGYDLNKSGDVTLRPHWRILKSIQRLGEGERFHTNILYVNNMDYMGAATNVDSSLLSRFLCNWSKMVCSGGNDPKETIHSHVYSIGMSEHQYDFRELNEFFKLSAEEKLLERTLNSVPSSDTQELLDFNYFKKIDLGIPWLDGLCRIQSTWDHYCSTQWDPSKPVCNNEYSVSQQELTIATYLNLFLKLYIAEEQREIDILNAEKIQKENEKSVLLERLEKLNEIPEEDETRDEQINLVNEQVTQLDLEIEGCYNIISVHNENIKNNTFYDADTFHHEFGTLELITEEDEATYSSNRTSVERLIAYVKSEDAFNIMIKAIGRATTQDVLPEHYPASEVKNMGRVKAIEFPLEEIPELPKSQVVIPIQDNKNENSGCLFWFKQLFKKEKKDDADKEVISPVVIESVGDRTIDEDAKLFLEDKLRHSIAALKKADEVHKWWNNLCSLIEKDKKRLSECKLLMDGEKNVGGDYILGKEGYQPKQHRKSTSLIDMDRVRYFRETDEYYKSNIDTFLERWFDKSIEINKRMTMPELIKHQVLDPLVGRYHTLRWDGKNPFVKEILTDEEIHGYIEHDLSQSKPFVEYVRVQESNLISNLSIGFYSNNQNLPTEPTEFRKRFNVSAQSMCPICLKDFVNSLCVVQIMDIPDHVDSLKDFKPRRDATLSKMHIDIKNEVATIIGDAESTEEKAKAIYNWICDNIKYDTTEQISDAETCYKTRRGVCQAYCELFCYMAEAVGLTADIITGKTKDMDGKISGNKHSWIYVYTHAYDGLLIDPTWGAGSVDGVKFIKSKDNSAWFNVGPYRMIFTHFPDQQHWAKLDITITEEQFRKLPIVEKSTEDEYRDFLFDCIS